MKFEIKAYNMQEMGQRQNQEDSLFPGIGEQTSADRVFILCDGMGGHEKGEVASATVCETMSQTIAKLWSPELPFSDTIFQQALSDAFDALDAKDNGEARKMGTTMTFVCLHSEGATVAHIGDSRVYQLRPVKDGNPARIMFRTQDHSLVNDLVKIGEITEEEAKHHPQKNVITRAMQPCQEYRVKADIAHLTDIQPGDYFYMCSDGMLEEATDENILNIITKPDATNDQKIEILRGATSENKDNHTAHLIYIDKVEGAVVPPAAKESEQTGPKGTFITPDVEAPEFEEPKDAPTSKAAVADIKQQPAASQPTKKHNSLPLIVGAVVIAAIAIAATFFMKTERGNEAAAGQDTAKVESTETHELKPATHPKKKQAGKATKAKVAEKDKTNAEQATTTPNNKPLMEEVKELGAAKANTASKEETQPKSTPPTKKPGNAQSSVPAPERGAQAASATNTTQPNPDQTK